MHVHTPRTEQKKKLRQASRAQAQAPLQRYDSFTSLDSINKEKLAAQLPPRPPRPSHLSYLFANLCKITKKFSPRNRNRFECTLRRPSQPTPSALENLSPEEQARQKRYEEFQRRNRPAYEVYVCYGTGVLVIAPGATRLQRRSLRE